MYSNMLLLLKTLYLHIRVLYTSCVHVCGAFDEDDVTQVMTCKHYREMQYTTVNP